MLLGFTPLPDRHRRGKHMRRRLDCSGSPTDSADASVDDNEMAVISSHIVASLGSSRTDMHPASRRNVSSLSTNTYLEGLALLPEYMVWCEMRTVLGPNGWDVGRVDIRVVD